MAVIVVVLAVTTIVPAGLATTGIDTIAAFRPVGTGIYALKVAPVTVLPSSSH